VLMLYYWTN